MADIVLAETAKEWFENGNKALRVEKYDEAIECYKKAISINPDYADAHFNLGIVYEKKGMLDEEIAEFKKAIGINPDYARVHYNLGVAYDEKGMADEAITEYKKAIKINPADAEAHLKLGVAYGKKEMTDERISEFKKAIKINPNYADAYYNLGVAYGEKKMYSVGADYLYKAGLLFLKQGDREGALKAYEGLKLTKSKKLEESLFKQLYPEIK